MDLIALNTMSSNPRLDPDRARAEKTAAQFEQIFVRTMVSSLRSTASVGGESMFGSGPGADTFADWFDQNLSEQIGRTSKVGIASQLLTDLERHGQIDADHSAQERTARTLADRSPFTANAAAAAGGFDVLL